MRKILVLILAASAFGLVFSSCTTPKGPQTPVPLTKEQLQALASRAKLAPLFGITIYPSADGPVFGGANRVHDGDVAEVSFPAGENSPAPLVQVTSGGSDPVDALIDTSSPQNWATLAMMNTLNIELMAAPSLLESRPSHVYDMISGFLGIAGHLKIDQAGMENALFQLRGAAGPLGPLARGMADPKLSVVLGVDTLKSFNHVQFNFPSHFVILSASTDYHPDADKLLATVPLIYVGGSIAAAGELEGAPASFILDTGGNYAVALPTNRPAAKVSQVSFGDLVIRDLAGTPCMDLALGPVSNPRLGRLALARYKVILDFRRRNIYFEKP